MIQINNKVDCSGCHACFNICPVECIKMEVDNEGFWYPNVDESKCIGCGLCEKVCPIINKKEEKNNNDIKAYACINKDDEIREKSSSGGVFSILSEYVIQNNGAVFGSAFNENLELIHSCTESIEGLEKFRSSKYLQSKIGSTYKEVKVFLENGKNVLYSGTPCQIDGLKSYLGKDYENLICIDIICHGVPSPKVFDLYLKEFNEKFKTKFSEINFRDKFYGWKYFSLLLSSKDKTYRKKLNQDLYMKGFLSNLYLRPSCYDCKSKTLNRSSDITIADFWGIINILPEMDDDKGTSLVLVHTEKGKQIRDYLKEKMNIKEVICSEAIKYNSAAIKSVNENPKRKLFFDELENNEQNISELINKYTKISILKKIYIFIRRVLSKLKRMIKK